jgi:hypothetical protein
MLCRGERAGVLPASGAWPAIPEGSLHPQDKAQARPIGPRRGQRLDAKMDGIFPLVTNDKRLPLRRC